MKCCTKQELTIELSSSAKQENTQANNLENTRNKNHCRAGTTVMNQ